MTKRKSKKQKALLKKQQRQREDSVLSTTVTAVNSKSTKATTNTADPVPRMQQQSFGYAQKTCKSSHTGLTPIKIGGFDVYLGAYSYLDEKAVTNAAVLCPLNGDVPYNVPIGTWLPMVQCEMRDFGGVPEGWAGFIDYMVRLIRSDYHVLAWCTGSHGRTGTFGASLIAVMEPETEDPIEAIRERHCKHAVETLAQAVAIYSLRGQKLPEKYRKEFDRSVIRYPTTYQTSKAVGSAGRQSNSHLFDGNVNWWDKYSEEAELGVPPDYFVQETLKPNTRSQAEEERLLIEKATAFLHKKD